MTKLYRLYPQTRTGLKYIIWLSTMACVLKGVTISGLRINEGLRTSSDSTVNAVIIPIKLFSMKCNESHSVSPTSDCTS